MNSKPVDPASRRQVLKAITVGLPAAALAGRATAADPPAPESGAPAPGTPPQSAPSPATPPAAAATGGMPAWQFFNAEEAALMDAIVARLIPADDLGPGAREAGVTTYIDRQLAGAWGSGDHFYRSGPFASGTPQQGYQLSYTPAEMFRTGLARFAQAVRQAQNGKSFTELDAAAQDDMLARMEAGKLDFSPLPSAVFFGALMDATIEGFFCDPIHGGNRDMVGWKLVQFPGAYASYSNDIERHGVAFVREPVSIANSPVHDMPMHGPTPQPEKRTQLDAPTVKEAA
ncbi:gluconate 2-dehydrogenase subunit 3 family protein [Bordetella genomosp. 9]|uniref:Gluconate 2-dehydrogenase n=1 Tax=Bordetella genomosp. 9 TaxID=1416803 RepID=A0A1W6YZJ9_9BORD|nr:gluconate 2-dehydrogenase subunit 3 family protein [Bordetella genomosp. 9]ARP86013.1 gluconate 2-dehydrogenase [Bordetella genomosp. 9]